MIVAVLTRGQICFWVRTVLLAALLLGSASSSVDAASPIAAGQITDLQGRALAGVLVQAESWESKPLGTGRTDAEGRFRIVLSQPVADLTVIVEHPGFQRWAMAGTSEGQDRYRIRLTRKIDDEYLTELAAQSEPGRFKQLAMDLLAPSEGTVGNDGLQIEHVLPFLKSLRERLRALLPAKPGQIKSIKLKDYQDKAALLLAYLGDPRDDALVDGWAVKNDFVSSPSKSCKGPTPEAAARAWQKLHFKKEGYRTPENFPFNTLQTHIAPSGDHGLALHTVRYANWGYSMNLVLVRLNQVWEVRRIIDGKHWDRF